MVNRPLEGLIRARNNVLVCVGMSGSMEEDSGNGVTLCNVSRCKLSSEMNFQQSDQSASPSV